jgi:hypothetical protein
MTFFLGGFRVPSKAVAEVTRVLLDRLAVEVRPAS